MYVGGDGGHALAYWHIGILVGVHWHTGAGVHMHTYLMAGMIILADSLWVSQPQGLVVVTGVSSSLRG